MKGEGKESMTISNCDAIQAIAISDREWRVSDLRKAETDGLPLLGFVKQAGDDFEVTELGHPQVRTHHRSFQASISYLARTNR
jgi:hypothetical protein